MASQVRSGTNTTLSWANNTGQNVRVVINYLRALRPSGGQNITMTAGNMTINFSSTLIVGRNLAHSGPGNNQGSDGTFEISCPTEVMLESGQVFSVTGSCTFNIVFIPEAG